MGDNPEAASGSGSTFLGQKIRLTNIPKFLSPSVLRQAVAEHLKVSVDSITCRKSDKWTFALVAFKAAGPLAGLGIEGIADRLGGMKYRKYEFGVKVEDEREKQAFEQKEGALEKSLCDQVTPLWQLSYEEQLAKKQQHMSSVLKNFYKKSEHASNISALDGILEPIVASPVQNGYRNKCEFGIGWNRAGEPCVGFSLGGFRDGLLITENASDCLHVPTAMKDFANHLEAFIRQPEMLATYPVFDRVKKEGFWRLMMCRMHGNALMVVLQVQDGFLGDKSVFKEMLLQEIDSFNSGSDIKVESLFIQWTKMLHHGLSTTEPYEPLESFKSALTERLAGLDFRISPSSFFQVNLPATELLYAKIKQLATEELGTDKKPVLLDVCCGTGTIGMIMSSDSTFEKIIGIEMVASAVEDAKLNAQLNGIGNVEFHCARVEQIIRDIINAIPMDCPIVAVLDPPRNGVHPDVIKTLRSCERLRRLVYVSCNPEAAVGNWVDLQRPTSKAFHHSPFELSKAIPVDMFPHTEHCELVLRFDRK